MLVDPHPAAFRLPLLFLRDAAGRPRSADGLARSVARRPAYRPLVFPLVPGFDRRGLRTERVFLRRRGVPGDHAGCRGSARSDALAAPATTGDASPHGSRPLVREPSGHRGLRTRDPLACLAGKSGAWESALPRPCRGRLCGKRAPALSLSPLGGAGFPGDSLQRSGEPVRIRRPGHGLAVEHGHSQLWLVPGPARRSSGADLAGDVRNGSRRPRARNSHGLPGNTPRSFAFWF